MSRGEVLVVLIHGSGAERKQTVLSLSEGEVSSELVLGRSEARKEAVLAISWGEVIEDEITKLREKKEFALSSEKLQEFLTVRSEMQGESEQRKEAVLKVLPPRSGTFNAAVRFENEPRLCGFA